jgi:hypothetical protein
MPERSVTPAGGRRSDRWGTGMWPHHKMGVAGAVGLLIWNAIGTVEPWASVAFMAAWLALIVWETR